MGFVLSACETNDPNMSKESPFPGFVNLGLPSGTHWKEHNETMCELAEALALYGDSLATIAQWKELYKYCTWTWTGDGYNVKGRNGNSIFLPAEGTYVPYYHEWKDVGSRGEYWTATADKDVCAFHVGFPFDVPWAITGIGTGDNSEDGRPGWRRYDRFSVRLVRDVKPNQTIEHKNQ